MYTSQELVSYLLQRVRRCLGGSRILSPYPPEDRTKCFVLNLAIKYAWLEENHSNIKRNWKHKKTIWNIHNLTENVEKTLLMYNRLEYFTLLKVNYFPWDVWFITEQKRRCKLLNRCVFHLIISEVRNMQRARTYFRSDFKRFNNIEWEDKELEGNRSICLKNGQYNVSERYSFEFMSYS